MSGSAYKNITDRYEVMEELGRGGMANVYKATQVSLDRVVAIKEIKAAFSAHPELVERFKREARTAASMVHENIVQVYNFGEPREGSLFIVMEYVEGKDLKSLLGSGGPLPTGIAAVIAREVARALSYAHARGFVHRDVKPANVMISRRGEVKLMDFGIVRQMDSDLTRTGAFLGTPSYMSPEQLLGEDVTPASDIFSLGVVLYEILTGQKPFRSDNESTLSKKVRTEKETKVRALNPEVPWRLQSVVHKCLAKDPRKRFHTADELARALMKCIGAMSREQLRLAVASWMEDLSGMPAGPDVGKAAPPAAPLKPSLMEKPPEPVKAKKLEEEKTQESKIVIRQRADQKTGARSPAGRKTQGPEPEPEKSARAKTEKAPEKTRAVSPAPAPKPGQAEEDGAAASGDWLLKWVFRLVLLAIAALAAIVAFTIFDPGAAGSGKKSAFQRIIEMVLPGEEGP